LMKIFIDVALILNPQGRHRGGLLGVLPRRPGLYRISLSLLHIRDARAQREHLSS
jgi:hypothetical protein